MAARFMRRVKEAELAPLYDDLKRRIAPHYPVPTGRTVFRVLLVPPTGGAAKPRSAGRRSDLLLATRAGHRPTSVHPIRVVDLTILVAFTHQACQTKQAEQPDPAVIVMLAAVSTIISHSCLTGRGRVGRRRSGRLPVRR